MCARQLPSSAPPQRRRLPTFNVHLLRIAVNIRAGRHSHEYRRTAKRWHQWQIHFLEKGGADLQIGGAEPRRLNFFPVANVNFDIA